jgi:fructose-1,6-bisphosphatase/inositol monophosphatase family enzyme
MDLAKIVEIVRETRGLTFPNFGTAAFRQKGDHDNDFVTDLDVAVEERLRERLGGAFPGVPFVGEETGGDRSAPTRWLCDPIDGTGHFVRGTPFCTTMLALVDDNVPVMSVIYDFVHDVVWSAEAGKGAFRNGEATRVSDRPLRRAYVSWETHLDKEENLRRHLALASRCTFIKTLNAGYEFGLVAEGRLDGRLCFDPYGKDYDFAAGALIVREAGGVVANVGRRDYDVTNLNFLAANPVVFAELTEGSDALFPIAGE